MRQLKNWRIPDVFSYANESILRKVVSNGKDSYRVATHIIKSTQLDNIKVLPDHEHIIIPVSSLISPLSLIDLLFEDFSNFKTSVCHKLLNLIKQELSDVKQNTNKSDRQSRNDETCHRNALDEENHCLKAIAPVCYKNYTTIIEKYLDNILPNSQNVKGC